MQKSTEAPVMNCLRLAPAILLLSTTIIFPASRATAEPPAIGGASGCGAASSGAGALHPEGSLLPSGYLHTDGSQIVDQSGTAVRIAAVGWTQDFENPDATVQKMLRLGFNAVRVSWVNATMQADLARIDRIVTVAGKHGLKVILDHHTDEAGTPADSYGAQQKNGLWYDSGPGTDDTNGAGIKGTVTQDRFMSDWVAVAKRYAGNSTVIGYDLDNEPLEMPRGSTWGDGSVTDIRRMYQTVGNAILAAEPNVLVIAEGPQNYKTGMPWGDLSKVSYAPVRLAVPNRVVYSVHDYPAYVADFRPDSGPRKVALMNKAWGYLVTKNIAPVWLGEMGASMDGSAYGEVVSESEAWAATMISYLNGKLAEQGGPTFTAGQQGISTDWWAWGHLQGQQLNGTLEANGSPRQKQLAVYSQFRQIPVCDTQAAPRGEPVR
jgi:endoglucanase